MLRNAVRQLDRKRPVLPLPAQAGLFLNKCSNYAYRYDSSAAIYAASPSLPTETCVPTDSSEVLNLRNKYKSQQDAAPIRLRHRQSQVENNTVHGRRAANKSLEHMAASDLLQKALGRGEIAQYWRRRISEFRSNRFSIVLLQEFMRKEESEVEESSGLLSLLPTNQEMERILKHPSLAIYDREVLDHSIHILRGHDDDERCRRFLEKPSSTPLFIFNFLIRSSSNIRDTGTLLAMIESCCSYFYYSGRAKVTSENESLGRHWGLRSKFKSGSKIDQGNFNLVMRLLVVQCLRLEPRFIVKLADAASQFIQHVAMFANEPKRLYLMQCDILNRCLEMFQPQPHLRGVQKSIPNVYFWEAQRILLTLSSSFKKPLLISRSGFRAIRNVLSGQPKNYTELHSSSRHVPSWPPYLQPGHGMDELSDPEDNWSRTVCAGMLMQEAGFSKDEVDDAVDVLQGMAPDGAPTIQQRRLLSNRRHIGLWEASIRSTRNAQEAWERFKNPAEAGMKPGLDQYAAMFEKLVLREADIDSRVLLGDKALNFSTQHEANLTEFERARLRPPSISELYEDMKLAGIAPKGSCLQILVANAGTLESVHQYFSDSAENNIVVQSLTTDEPDPNLLRTVPLGLFAAYIQACLRVEGRERENQLMRVIRLTETRLKNVESRWAGFVWGIILKNLSQHHRAMRISFPEQLKLMARIVDIIEASHGLQLSSFSQFSKCIRKATRREVNKLIAFDSKRGAEARHGFPQATYCRGTPDAQYDNVSSHHDATATRSGQTDLAGLIVVLSEARSRLKSMFWALADRERAVQMQLNGYQVPPLERFNSRRDAVRSDHAHEYMLTLGYLGEYEEMARVLSWLIQEWSSSDIVTALNELEAPPPYANFSEIFCLFRLVAEPILENSRMESLLQELADSQMDWTWPDDKAVKTYADLHEDGSIGTLQRIMEMMQDRSRALQHSGNVRGTNKGLDPLIE